MYIPEKKKSSMRRGSVLLVTVVLLAFAGITIGSIFVATMTYAKNSESVYAHDKAAFLADAGLNAATVRLNLETLADITYADSKAYFSQTATFAHPDWGFETQLTITNGDYIVRSTGRYNGNYVTIRSGLGNEAGPNSIHAIYVLALYAGNSSGDTNYILKVGGTGTGADFVKGDVYSGNNLELSGTAKLRLPEILVDTNFDGIASEGETWTNSYAVQTFTNPLSQAAFNTYQTAQNANSGKTYGNGRYDYGEAFVDTIGNGVYDVGEPYTDVNGNGKFDAGDDFVDRNGNGVYDVGIDTVVDNGNGKWDVGEEWVEDPNSTRSQYRKNGKYDKAGGYWSGSTWKTTYGSKNKSCGSWPAESFMDLGDGVYSPTDHEPYTDQNGIYDEGEQYVDDRNSLYDYGTQATGKTTGMPAPGPGQKAASGNNNPIDPPLLTNMYYSLPKTGTKPGNALPRWGNDVVVTASDYGTAKVITDTSKPQHIFIRNPPTSGSVKSGGKTIQGRQYTPIKNTDGDNLDDYFLEDPTDPTYGTSGDQSKRIATVGTGNEKTAPMFLNVVDSGNGKVYYVDGNLYLHSPTAYSMRFRKPGTRITIVASGNITISDEFYYNADYATGIDYANVNSTIVNNPSDALCLIALKNPAAPTSTGNILIGDSQFGTGGSIHAMLYAENDFVDNNLNTSDQSFISIYGNMTAGNQIRLNRTVGSGQYRTRLDITLDERVRDATVIIPGLPHPVGTQRSAMTTRSRWCLANGTWSSFSYLQ